MSNYTDDRIYVVQKIEIFIVQIVFQEKKSGDWVVCVPTIYKDFVIQQTIDEEIYALTEDYLNVYCNKLIIPFQLLRQEGKMKIEDALKKAKELSKRRNFNQTWDLIINLKGLDLKRPENRINVEFTMPENVREKSNIVFIANELAKDASKFAKIVITKDKLEKITRKEIKELTKQADMFFAEISLMPLVGKILGPVLGPKNKMPKPIPPKVKLDVFLANVNKIVRARVKDSPVLQIAVGKENMDIKSVAKNVEAFLNYIVEKMPKGRANIRSVYVKLTMGKPVRVI